MTVTKSAPTPEMENLLSELRTYMEDHKSAPAAPGPSGIQFSLMEEAYDEPDQTSPENIESFSEYLEENKIACDESNIRDIYLEWELKNGLRKSFGSEVCRLVDWKFEKPTAFYTPVGMNKRTFHKIKTDYGYRPSKKTAFQCCIGLHLDVPAAEKLLKLAGYALSPSDPCDLVIRFCLEKEIWDIGTINYLLSSFDLESLDG